MNPATYVATPNSDESGYGHVCDFGDRTLAV